MKDNLTQDVVRQWFVYDYKTGELFWKNRRCNRCNLKKPVGLFNKRGLDVGFFGKLRRVHRLVWIYHYGYLPECGIDHIDRNPINNRIENLRQVSQVCNSRNTGNRKNNTSGVKGVYWNQIYRKWIAQIYVNYKVIGLGSFANFIDAVKARYKKECELEWHGCDSFSPAFQFLETQKGEVHV